MLSISLDAIETDGVTLALGVIANADAADVPHAFVAVTVMLPAVVPVVTVIEFVVPPAVIVDPAGTVQLYDVAPPTAVIEQLFPVVEAQGVVDPEIVPGVAGVEFTVIVIPDDVAVALVTQDNELVITHVTI